VATSDCPAVDSGLAGGEFVSVAQADFETVGIGETVCDRTAVCTGDIVAVRSADFETVLGRDALRVRIAVGVGVGVRDLRGVCMRVCDRGGTGVLEGEAQAVASHDCRPEIA
jgi:hypothetical protein